MEGSIPKAASMPEMPSAEAAEHVKTAKIERAEIRKTTGKLANQADRTTELAAD